VDQGKAAGVEGVRVTAGAYVTAFRVTFLFEQHLMELRKRCFDESKQCAHNLDLPARS
jgi:hypothetical protein